LAAAQAGSRRLLESSAIRLAMMPVVALLAAAAVWLQAPLALRLPLGLAAALFLPGYSLTMAAFPSAHDLRAVERLGLALGLSFAIIMTIVGVLNYSPWGVHPVPLTVALTGSTLAISFAAWLRKRQLVRRGEPRAKLRAISGRLSARSTHLVFISLVAAVLLPAAALAKTLTASQPPLTEFYILGPQGLVQDYPMATHSDEPISVMVGIANRERRAETYRIAIQQGEATLYRFGPVSLLAGGSWEQRLEFRVLTGGENQAVLLTLTKDGEPLPYRQLQLRIDKPSPELTT